jgi:hypothetical protein
MTEVEMDGMSLAGHRRMIEASYADAETRMLKASQTAKAAGEA